MIQMDVPVGGGVRQRDVETAVGVSQRIAGGRSRLVKQYRKAAGVIDEVGVIAAVVPSALVDANAAGWAEVAETPNVKVGIAAVQVMSPNTLSLRELECDPAFVM